MRIHFASDTDAPAPALEALELLGHEVRRAPLEADAPRADEPVIVDARDRLLLAKNALVRIAATSDAPRIALVSADGFGAVNESWPVDDLLLDTARHAEVEARLRLVLARRRAFALESRPPALVREAGIEVDEGSYTARVDGRPLNLTYKEFELLKFLAGSPDLVFSRDELLAEVWGSDYYGGSRTVDVHIRRLRAKLGSDHEAVIRTVRNVGYMFARTASADDDGGRG
ncbi:winged-helix domain-containing protein [Falsarthrobacter nasiphocae]|uniref:OmpR/PhoB-type domain-containing protein n=1 Tax=Falsarthrobacter nasiphocae TaxID=189863 RepID=A0AAE4C6T2_9MICC|nr:winged-helix domain-containing protein [Falsarthrobacter nasiphocae]MDR6892492.1 hypothetical protein [Falsarthrobacter nasiphocae]